MANLISRRSAIRALLGAVCGATLAPVTSSAQVKPYDTFFWRQVGGPFCSGGTLYQTWCFMDCGGGTCEPQWCQNRAVGSC